MIDRLTHRGCGVIALRGEVLRYAAAGTEQSRCKRMMRLGLAIQARQEKADGQEEKHASGDATKNGLVRGA
ncbi:hypothetical protein [Burkholderia ambifaria]|uniref:hypothetical protein n=1 Tax=Burkholderia ambifaria TaxID=152480 RepID=UPI00158B5FA4|nr:hypothetical protein [Burkholderia ambifaria]WDR87837.1 hypothetical protein OR986_04375 [Burkholderia ambifaria]WDS00563.1 hypothetical protein OR985_09325 [Burkholderia ambifaria]